MTIGLLQARVFRPNSKHGFGSQSIDFAVGLVSAQNLNTPFVKNEKPVMSFLVVGLAVKLFLDLKGISSQGPE